ncbi:MAG: exodeoxyribonuclease III, partial [Verrucomicrobia bacterium]
ASEALAKRCTTAGIDREMRKGKEPSDHAPVWAEFE